MADSDTNAPPILYHVDRGVATVTLNQPERKNSLSDELVTTLWERLGEAMSDDSVRVVVITNNGNTFCAGADLKAAKPGTASPKVGPGFVGVFTQILDGPKPVIGRINGHATGGGVGLAAACDISIMRNDSLIGFTEVRIGVAPAIISVVCLPKLSRADANELFLTGERISPDRAATAGLINRAVNPEDLDATVDHYISMLVRGGPDALAGAKRLIRDVPASSRDEAFTWTAKLSAELFGTEEAQAGIAAFRERRNAPWVPEGW